MGERRKEKEQCRQRSQGQEMDCFDSHLWPAARSLQRAELMLRSVDITTTSVYSYCK